MNTLYLKNVSGSDITLSGVGVTIANGASADILANEGVTPNSVYLDDNIRTLIEDGDIVVRLDDIADLSAANSLILFDHRMNRPTHNLTASPGVNHDIDDGFSIGDSIADTSGNAVWKCEDNSSGAASWAKVV